MKAVIITVPERAEYVKQLAALIEPEVETLTIFEDREHRGHWWNSVRAWRHLTDTCRPNEPGLFVEDDAITVPGWRSRWEDIHRQAQNDIYVLFSRQRHLFKPENIAAGYVTRPQPRGFYGLASIVINQSGIADRVLDWLHHGGGAEHPKVKPRISHWDVVMQEYLLEHGHQFTITTPTLFDHRQGKSTLGHAIGTSPLFIGTHKETDNGN